MPKGIKGFQKGHEFFGDKKNLFRKGEHLSPKTEFKKGEHPSKETEFKKGMTPWNKGLKGLPPRHTKKHSEKTKEKISRSRKNKCKGSNNPAWKGGHLKHDQGYVLIYNPNHPFCNSAGYIHEHRLVMEKHLGRYLTKKEVVHHINRLRHDNHIDNLVLFPSNVAHMKFHYPKKSY